MQLCSASSATFLFSAQREAAIVTPIPGTTRDILELSLDLGGLPVIVADTAGLRNTDDVVEKIGVERARQASANHIFLVECMHLMRLRSFLLYRVENADIALCVLSLPEVVGPAIQERSGTLDFPQSVAPLITPKTFVLLNKTDLVPPDTVRRIIHSSLSRTNKTWAVSLSNDEGTQAFMDGFADALKNQ